MGKDTLIKLFGINLLVIGEYANHRGNNLIIFIINSTTMKSLLIYSLLIFSFTCYGQTNVYQTCTYHCGGTPGGLGFSQSICSSDDGTGNINLIVDNWFYQSLRNCDSSGNVIWNSIFTDSIPPDTVHNINDTITFYQTLYYSVISHPGNGYAMAGETDSIVSVKNAAGSTIYQGGGQFINISRISSTGNIQWSKILSYIGSYYTHPQLIYNSVSSKYLIYYNSAIVVLDSTGNIDFTMIFNNNVKYSCTTRDGNFLVGVNNFLCKIDTSGNILFANSYSNGSSPNAPIWAIAEFNGHVVFTSDSNLVYCDSLGQVLWSLASNQSFGGLLNWHNSNLKVFVSKYYSFTSGNSYYNDMNLYTNTIDSNANLLSSCFSISTHSFSANLNTSNEGLSAISMNDNHILFSSSADGVYHIGGVGRDNTLSQNDYNGCGCRTTSNSYTPIFTPSLFINTPFSPSYFLTTTYSSRSYGIVNSFWNPWHVIACQGYVNVENMAKDKTFLSITPNPANTFTIISAPYFTSSNLTLYDLTGRILHQQNFNAETTFNIQSLNSGMYIVEIKDALGKSAKRKLIKK